jgi:VWFA-related protein
MRLVPHLVVIALAAPLGAQEGTAPPTFSSRVDLVTVDVVVLDGDGRPLRGLTREDFTLFEDGKAQQVESFEAFDWPDDPSPSRDTLGTSADRDPSLPAGTRTFVLLVDDANLSPVRHTVVREAVERFLVEGVRDGDELIFASTSGHTWWSARMPEGREDVRALMARVIGRSPNEKTNDAMTDWEAYRITNFEGTSEARLESAGGSGAATGPPNPTTGTPAGALPANVAAPGANITERVVARWLERNVCSPYAVQMCRSNVHARAHQIDARRLNRTRDTLAAIDRAVFALTGLRGRKSLLLLTDGFLNDPSVSVIQEVAGRCREANVAVYSLDARGLISGLEDELTTQSQNVAELGLMQSERLEFAAAGNAGLAEDTGGLAIRNTNDLGGAAVRVADESRVYYLLGYAPPEGKGSRDWRKLRVEVGRPGVRVRARKGYTLRSAAEIAAAGSPSRESGGTGRDGKSGRPPAVPPEVARALLAPQERADIPVRAMAYALDERPGGLVAIALAVEADLAKLANLGGEDRPRGAVSLSIAATHRDTGRVQRIDQRVQVDAGLGSSWEGWLALSRELELAPGVVQVRVVVRDEFLGHLGFATVRFEVPPPGGLRLSTPILADRLRPAATGTVPMPVLLARRDFTAGRPLYCVFQVFGARVVGSGPAIFGSYLVRGADGSTLQEGPFTPITASPEGRLVRLLGLPLEGLGPGAYELVVRVEDRTSGRVVERTEPFRLHRPDGVPQTVTPPGRKSSGRS